MAPPRGRAGRRNNNLVGSYLLAPPTRGFFSGKKSCIEAGANRPGPPAARGSPLANNGRTVNRCRNLALTPPRSKSAWEAQHFLNLAVRDQDGHINADRGGADRLANYGKTFPSSPDGSLTTSDRERYVPGSAT
jgi:hypothetical protein